ncbi:single-stranded-DNA-specific exonuclease RecJ [Dorea amylophila]|uniref:Single-stranded-DNA-specific exonuclease RecJ n=1 Tax=Dorea longicatena TaxID=88431 RepID=A0A174J9S2_9FIRM|nr:MULTISPECIES: single-stranded-DNA-specific exonuclease RecJ [Dorea]MCU6739771.1 single-stranded-DNA-specific exonuclease RecJ [Dorea amylophila]CUO93945.1 Single-stranded-DNA-specific exonuclease recJ [Dorea longicatena]
MERWVLLRKGADFEAIGKKYQISPRLACLIRNRDVIGEEAVDRYLNGTISDLYDGMLMKDMDKAIDILKEKILEDKKIRVIGDYDIDGVNATYILLEGLERLGADVDSDIPDRISDGYGLNRHLVERAYEAGVDTLITCDNGIAAADEIAYGKEMGMTVIVTDHHEVPFDEQDGEKRYRIPPADAVMDPKQPDCLYPFKGLCGAAVAYKLMEALWESMGMDSADLDDLIENVAIATIGDVMDLEDENRIFVKEGLQMLRRTKNPGLKALIECTGIDKNSLNSYHIGFVLGPCINASGRLDTAKRALELLRAGTQKEADILAGDLKALNDSRKDMTEEAVKQAEEQVETTTISKDKVLVVYLPDCHESLAGIVAGRIRENYYKPVFVLTDAEEGVKGSGRSIDGYHMYEELNKCKEFLTKFGGHRLAAGLSLPKENVGKFREMLNKNCTLTEEEMKEKVTIDMEMPFGCVTEGLVKELELLEPFGKGNTKPVFAARDVTLLGARILGKNRNVLKLQVQDVNGCRIEAMLFHHADDFLGKLEEQYGKTEVEALLKGRGRQIRISMTYYPDINEYMGKKTPQIVVTHYR